MFFSSDLLSAASKGQMSSTSHGGAPRFQNHHRPFRMRPSVLLAVPQIQSKFWTGHLHRWRSFPHDNSLPLLSAVHLICDPWPIWPCNQFWSKSNQSDKSIPRASLNENILDILSAEINFDRVWPQKSDCTVNQCSEEGFSTLFLLSKLSQGNKSPCTKLKLKNCRTWWLYYFWP